MDELGKPTPNDAFVGLHIVIALHKHGPMCIPITKAVDLDAELLITAGTAVRNRDGNNITNVKDKLLHPSSVGPRLEDDGHDPGADPDRNGITNIKDK